jgi:hypothetical protein
VLKLRFRGRSKIAVYPLGNNGTIDVEGVMTEFIRGGLIFLMGMTVMAAGILVIFYG